MPPYKASAEVPTAAAASDDTAQEGSAAEKSVDPDVTDRVVNFEDFTEEDYIGFTVGEGLVASWSRNWTSSWKRPMYAWHR